MKLPKRLKTFFTPITRTVKQLSVNGWWFLLLFGLTAGAISTLIWAQAVGVYINAGVLAALMTIAVLKKNLRLVAISVGVIPVANMLLGSIVPGDALRAIAIYDVTLMLLASLYRYLFDLEAPVAPSRLKLRGYATMLPLMVVIGQAVGIVGFAFLHHHYMFRSYPLPLVFPVVIALAIAEETIFRGLIQQRAAQVFHPLVAALGTAALYCLMALDHATLLSLPVAALTGLVLAITYYKKPNLILTITVNAASKLAYVGLVAAFVLR